MEEIGIEERMCEGVGVREAGSVNKADTAFCSSQDLLSVRLQCPEKCNGLTMSGHTVPAI